MRRPVRAAAVVGALLAGVLTAVPVAGAGGRASGWLGQAISPGALAMREIARGDQSNIDDLRQVVVRTPADWQRLWREHDYDAPPPRVDFAKEMVVAVFLGSQASAGHGVRVTDVAPAGEGLLVRYQASRPAPGAVAAQVLTFPFHIVAVPMRTGPVRFDRSLP